jgi:putative membrane protein
VLGIAPKTEDFLKEVAMSDMTEIEAAKIAQQKGNADEKKFAEMMLADYTKTSNELKATTPADLKAALPAALDDASEKKLAKLRDAKPEDFASVYDPMQVSAHKDAVSLFERYASGGENPKLKEWAGKTLPPLKHHLEMAGSRQQSEINDGPTVLKKGRAIFPSGDHPPQAGYPVLLPNDQASSSSSSSASMLTTDLAIPVSVLSVFFSSCNVASRRSTASPYPSSSAQVESVPYREIS